MASILGWLLFAVMVATPLFTLFCVVFLIRLERRVDRMQVALTATINSHNLLVQIAKNESMLTQAAAFEIAAMQRQGGYGPRVQ